MKTSFIAFLNKHGIACASDTDMTLYALSKQEPVAIAVNPYSPIPWDSIINAYLRKGCIPLHDDFSDYARDFAEFLKTVNRQKKWAGLTDEEANIIFLGFGQDDLFPSGVDAYVRHNTASNILECELREVCRIDHKNTSNYGMLGKFENMQPVLYCISGAAKTSLADRQEKDMNKYKERMKKALDNAHCDVALDDMPYDTQNAFSNGLRMAEPQELVQPSGRRRTIRKVRNIKTRSSSKHTTPSIRVLTDLTKPN